MNIKKLLLLAAWVLPLCATAQKLVEDKVDDFTKAKVKRTSWETICKKGGFWTYSKCSKIDSSRYLKFKIMSDRKVYVIEEGNELLLKIGTDSIITLKCLKRAISCRGCGAIGLVGSAAEGIEVDFFIPPDSYDFLIKNKINKMRLYTNGGFIEAEMKEDWAKLFIKQLELIK